VISINCTSRRPEQKGLYHLRSQSPSLIALAGRIVEAHGTRRRRQSDASGVTPVYERLTSTVGEIICGPKKPGAKNTLERFGPRKARSHLLNSSQFLQIDVIGVHNSYRSNSA